MDIETFDNYLKNLPIPVDDKRYSSTFFRRRAYLDNISHYVSAHVTGRVKYGYGNCNSKIFVVLDSPVQLKQALKFIPPCLEYINISIQNTWITFKAKGAGEELDGRIYAAEMKCIQPEAVIYVHEGDVTRSDGLNMHINMQDIEHVLKLKAEGQKDDRYMAVMKEVYAFLPRLIPLKEIEYVED